jgi:RNA polymerase sigma factor (sigma-70 family)
MLCNLYRRGDRLTHRVAFEAQPLVASCFACAGSIVPDDNNGRPDAEEHMPKRDGSSAPGGFDLLGAFLECRKGLTRLVARIVKPHDVDDILQETFIRVCAAAEKTSIQHPRSFMLKTAQNLALNHVTSAYQRRTQMEDFTCSDVSPLTLPLEDGVESEERFLGFCRAVRTLPPQCRRVFVLRKVYGLTQQEIAAYLEISESTVEKHIAKGLTLCRNMMGEMGHLNDEPKRGGRSSAVAEKRRLHG